MPTECARAPRVGAGYYMDGLMGIAGRTPMYMQQMADQNKVEEMCSEVLKRMNEAKHYPGVDSMQRM